MVCTLSKFIVCKDVHPSKALSAIFTIDEDKLISSTSVLFVKFFKVVKDAQALKSYVVTLVPSNVEPSNSPIVMVMPSTCSEFNAEPNTTLVIFL